MKKQIFGWIAGIGIFLSLLILTAVSKSPEAAPVSGEPTDQQVNLALREIGDYLLQKHNDFRTPIPPVCREVDGAYLLTIRQPIDYAGLRPVVDKILSRHGIPPAYRLSLLDCTSNEIVLGFLARPEDTDKAVACQDRETISTCYDLRIEFTASNTAVAERLPGDSPMTFSWILLGLAIGFPMFWMMWRRIDRPKPGEREDSGWIKASEHTAFHPANQQLRIAGETIDLTYREAKLLHYFIEHPQEVLEREQILEAVWGDEGVIVGRSLDVFVSRLRKKLQADPALQLVSVHGVGYKLM